MWGRGGGGGGGRACRGVPLLRCLPPPPHLHQPPPPLPRQPAPDHLRPVRVMAPALDTEANKFVLIINL